MRGPIQIRSNWLHWRLWLTVSLMVLGWLISPGILARQTEPPWKAVLDANSPSIWYPWKAYDDSIFYFEITYLTYETEPAFRFYVWTPKMGREGVDGFLYILPTRIVFDPTPKFKKHAFQFPNGQIKFSLQTDDQILLLILPGGHKIPFSPWNSGSTNNVPAGAHEAAQSASARWMALALSDFNKTKEQFEQRTSGIFMYPEVIQRFKAQASEWRTLAVKPEMPENAREHKVLAENAVQEKNFHKAMDEYKAALQIFPTWPEGQFNLAVICGETGDYGCAIEHMQNYLELVPDAPDAQAAKDKLIIWRDKEKT